jgi:hypothetical protein
MSIALLALSRGSLASPPADPASAPALSRARAQFQQGLALESAGDFTGALSAFQEVASVKLTPQVRFNIAICEEHLGKLTLALGEYRLTAVAAIEAGAADVAEQANEHAQSVQARIARVVIRRGSGAEVATLSLDGVMLGSTSIDSEILVDPGPHSVEARAAGFNLFMTSFIVSERETKAVEVTLAKASMAEGPSRPKSNEPESAALGSGRALAEPAPSSPTSPLRTASYIAAGVAGASFIASGVFLLLRGGVMSDLDDRCGPDRNNCPASAESLLSTGRTYTMLFDVTLVAGVVGLGTAATLVLVDRNNSPQTARALSSGRLKVAYGAPGALVGATLSAPF